VSDVDLSNVSALSDDRLDQALRIYQAEETTVSRLRRQVQAVMDRLNDEIGGRYRSGDASVDDLLNNHRQPRSQD